LLKLAGYLDNGNTPAFLKECRAIVAADDLVIGLDLAGLSYMSSTGVGAVSALALDARKSGRLFYLCNVPEKIDRVLSLLGFRESLTVIDNPLAFDFAPYVD
jgi:anti-anti-sigma factor